MMEQRPPDESFAIDKDAFSLYEPLFIESFQPRMLVQFRVVLPFQVPIIDGMMSLVNQDDTAVTCYFQMVEIPEVVYSGELIREGKFLTLPKYRTLAEMTLTTASVIELSLEESEDFRSKPLSDCFDKCLSGLNVLLRAALLKTQDVDIYRISRPMLQSASLCRLVPLHDWSQAVTGIFYLHMDLPYQKDVVSINDTRDIATFAGAINFGLNPIMLSQELTLNAARQFNKGFYQEAVIFSNLSVETLLSCLHTELLVELEAKSRAEAEALTSSITFNTLVKSGFKDRLGGKWDVTDQSTEIGKWWRRTYQLRNDVVHRGHFPSHEEADAALDAAFKFRVYIVNLIKRKKKKLPNLNSYFH
jgi:hypothetical protein